MKPVAALLVSLAYVDASRGLASLFTHRQTTRESNDADWKGFIGWKGESFDARDTFSNVQGWIETLSWEPRAYLYHNLLTEVEADHLISLAQPHMAKSEVVDSDTGTFYKSIERTSSGLFLSRGQDEVVRQIEQRIADWTRLPVENGEPLHVLRYQAGEEYKEHFDYFHDSLNTQRGGQRVATALMYLSDVDDGGETVFPSSTWKPSHKEKQHYSACAQTGLAVKPKKGDCLLFWSLRPDGITKDTKSLHAGCPVCPNGRSGEALKCDKWSATKWIRVGRHD